MGDSVDISEFEGWLQKGLGRVLLFLQNHDARPYRAAILHACTHDLAYDLQIEAARGQYLFEIMQQTGEPRFYRDIVLTALDAAKAEEEKRSESQLFEIARLLAGQGDEEARSVMRRRFARNAAEQDYTGAEEIVLPDGLEGFRFVAGHLAGMDFEEDGWQLDSWIEILEERYGREEAWNALLAMAAESGSPLTTLIEAVKAKRAEIEAWSERSDEERNAPRYPNFETLQRTIIEQGRKTPRGLLWGWSRCCYDAAEVKRAARALLAEEDSDLLLPYLRLFRYRWFPLDPDRLILLARSEDDEIAWAALDTLEHIRHPSVRALALELADRPRWCIFAVELLKRNYEAGDERLVESLLSRTLDANDYHWLGSSAGEFFEAHPELDCAPALTLLYERGPCTRCRGWAVEMLLERGQMPGWMREECRYDADLETRQLVEAQPRTDAVRRTEQAP
jgi:hypothetical protein